ncbi:MAG: hypothetical protein KUL82_05120 [Bdellovibrio sp.]|uniref:hypothetical protein n=1 Tax=Bdellovibrio sp. TaxID=28201 RepID=UPI0039E6DFC1|nr:hypothetical protein [Bdellovibrio sp.]
MLRRIFLSTLVVISAMTMSVSAFAEPEEHVMPASDDRWVPWPWALAQPFPWSDIQGLWKVEQGDFVSYFALKVVRQKATGLRQLQVKQFDGDTCRVLATGVGIERNQKILAQMTSKGGITYRVQLTAFNEKDSPIPPLRGSVPTQGVMVLSMGTLDVQGLEGMVHMQIMKISAYLTQKVCFDDVKK